MPRQGERRSHQRLDVAIERRVYRRKALRAAIEQVHRQYRSEDQQDTRFGQCAGRKRVEPVQIDIILEKGEGDRHADEIIPPHDPQRSETLELRLDNHRIGGDRQHGDQHQRIAPPFAPLDQMESPFEEQDARAAERRRDTQRPHP